MMAFLDAGLVSSLFMIFTLILLLNIVSTNGLLTGSDATQLALRREAASKPQTSVRKNEQLNCNGQTARDASSRVARTYGDLRVLLHVVTKPPHSGRCQLI